MLRKVLKGALSTIFVACLSFGQAFAQDERPEINVAVDNLWPTMDPVIGISTTGQRVHSNIFDTLIRRNRWEDPDGNTLVPLACNALGAKVRFDLGIHPA